MKRKIGIRAAALLLLLALLCSFAGCSLLGGEGDGAEEAEKKDDRSVPVYDNVFVAELGKKYQRMLNVKEPKIAVIGGSSVAFGLDSDLLSRMTGMAVVNFGLYATLGSKVMLDLSEEGLMRGDIAVFAPELDAQALSLYFGARSAWQAIDAYPPLYEAIAKRNGGDLAEAYDAYLADRAEYLEDGKPDPAGVYNAKNFNREGDVVYSRDYNTMALGYDPNTIFTIAPEIVSEDFIAYFNTYCANMADKGVTVYFSFCPINSLALAEGTDAEAIAAMENFFKENLACRVISSLDDYLMDWGYFYDTNLHLNSSGVPVRTAKLAEDIMAAEGRKVTLSVELPAPSGFEGSTPVVDQNEKYADCFLYRTEYLPSGEVAGLTIIGTTDKGKACRDDDITLPSACDGVPIIRIGEGALEGLPNLKFLRLEANIRYMDDGAFRGCANLREVYLNFGPEHCVVTTPDQDNPTGLMTDAPEGMLFFCPEEYKGDYQNDYTWGHYYRYFG